MKRPIWFSFLIAIILFATSFKVKAQVSIAEKVLGDTLADSVQAFKPKKITSPRKAAMFSAILPGLGQIYNQKYWKLPFIYGGAIAVVYAFNFNDEQYQLFRSAYILRRNGDQSERSLFNNYPDINQLSNARDFYRYYRDFSVILGLILYGLNIADATIDAHLAHFNVTDDLKLQVEPKVATLPNNAPVMQLGMRFTFR